MGSVAYNAPDSMFVRETRTIQLLLSATRAPEEVAADIRQPGTPRTARVEITDQMQAQLRGRGFEIDPQEPVVQPIRGSRDTEWAWQVTATERGRRELLIELSALVRIDDTERWLVVRRLADTIQVEVSAADRRGAILSEVWDFVKNNAQWVGGLLAAAAVAIATALGLRKRKE